MLVYWWFPADFNGDLLGFQGVYEDLLECMGDFMGFHGLWFIWGNIRRFRNSHLFQFWGVSIFSQTPSLGEHLSLVVDRDISLRSPSTKSHRIRTYAIYGNIYHQYTPVMLPYIPYIRILWEWVDRCWNILKPLESKWFDHWCGDLTKPQSAVLFFQGFR